MDILLHMVSGSRKLMFVEIHGDFAQVAAAEVEGEADEGVELVLVEL